MVLSGSGVQRSAAEEDPTSPWGTSSVALARGLLTDILLLRASELGGAIKTTRELTYAQLSTPHASLNSPCALKPINSQIHSRHAFIRLVGWPQIGPRCSPDGNAGPNLNLRISHDPS